MSPPSARGAGKPAKSHATHAAFVLHHYNWSESSLVLDLFTRDLGRIAVIAKGAKRPFSQMRAILLPFQCVNVSLSKGVKSADGVAEVQTLRGAEWTGGSTMPEGAAIFSAYYLNELLLKLLARQDPHPQLFDAYALALAQIARRRAGKAAVRGEPAGRGVAAMAGIGGDDEAIEQSALRAFELVLLREIGLLPDLSLATLTQMPLLPQQPYALSPNSGVVEPGRDDCTVSGATLIHLQAALEHGSHAALMQACAADLPGLRVSLRTLLYHHLGQTPLRTRQAMLDLQKLMDQTR